MPAASTVEITVVTPVETIDITPYVMFQTASFDFQANALPGTFEMTLKDVNRTLVFGSVSNGYAGINTGAEVYLTIDGELLFGGILMEVERIFAFPVVDTTVIEDVSARQFTLRGVDFNIWFDRRFLRDTANYTRGIIIPDRHYDGEIIRSFLPDYIDVPPGVTFTGANVEDIEEFGIKRNPAGEVIRVTGWKPGAQGDPWRKAMESLAWRSAALWYIDAEKHLVFKSLETALAPFSFTDHNPNGTTSIGCRAVRASQDGSPLVTDALVWGGLEQLATGGDDGIFFGRYPRGAVDDETEQKAVDARARYGRWQYAEVNFQQGDDQISVNNRAKAIVMGPPGNAGGVALGLHEPVWSIDLTWFAHNVPDGLPHLRPGQVTTIMLYVMGHEKPSGQWVPLVQTLPLRSVQITFPSIPVVEVGQFKTWVQFQGQFGINYSDTRQLWKFILRQHRRNTAASAGDYEAHGLVTAASTIAGFNAIGQFELTPNGVTTDFTFLRSGTPQAYLAGSLEVYLNGLRQRPGIEYEELPDDGQVTFYTAPFADDDVFCVMRCAGN